MDIELIEKFLTRLYDDFKEEGAKPDQPIFQFVQCQLLLHIYRKLDDIDGSLGAIYSELGEIRAALPSKW